MSLETTTPIETDVQEHHGQPLEVSPDGRLQAQPLPTATEGTSSSDIKKQIRVIEQQLADAIEAQIKIETASRYGVKKEDIADDISAADRPVQEMQERLETLRQQAKSQGAGLLKHLRSTLGTFFNF